MSGRGDYPTSGDYANHAARDARDEGRAAEKRLLAKIEALERRIKSERDIVDLIEDVLAHYGVKGSM